jgi:hypothetical protein
MPVPRKARRAGRKPLAGNCSCTRQVIYKEAFMDFFKKLLGKDKTDASSSSTNTEFSFVYVNQDGSVRELSPNEQIYLSTIFHGADGARPYIKANYKSSDGWDSQSGFMERRRVPKHIEIAPVNPNYDAAVKELEEDFSKLMLEGERAAGDIIRVNPDGSITSKPNPDIPRSKRFEIIKAHHLVQQQRREALAKI